MAEERLELRVAHLDCEHEEAIIRRGLAEFPGLLALEIWPRSAKVQLSFDPTITSGEALRQKLADMGFPARKGLEAVGPPKVWRNPKVLAALASGLLLLIGWLVSLTAASVIVSWVLYVAAILVGGYYFGREAIEELVFECEIGIELLMSLAAVAAAVMGLPAEGAMLAFLYSISEAAEGYTEEKTRSAIKGLMNLAPKMALVLRDGGEHRAPVEELRLDDVFVVKPGEAVATDGRVVAGSSSLNQAPVTGESLPVDKQVGDTVFAGSINSAGALQVAVTRTAEDNTIARIVHMVEEAQERKGRSQRFIERFGRRYSPLVLLVGILIAVLPPLLFGGAWNTWVVRATVFIVAAAPCALVISVPITMVATLGTGARRGVLVKGGLYMEELAEVQVVALDKTGTLTHGRPEVTDVLPVGDEDAPASAESVLALAGSLSRWSQHPLGVAIYRHAGELGIPLPDAVEFGDLSGAGASALVAGREVFVANPAFFSKKLGLSLAAIQEDIDRLQAAGKTSVLVGGREGVLGIIGLRDLLRPNARQAVAALHDAGAERVVMLTGDNQRTAEVFAAEVGIDEVYADLKPADKLAQVRRLREAYGRVVMVGDGVNDAPALAEATVGVAMGAAGSDVALETADAVLMADDLEQLAYGMRLARRSRSVVRQNLALSVVVITALVVGAVTGVLSLPIAVIGHEASEFLVVGNGLRMLRG